MLFQLSVGFVLTARDFSPGFAVFSPHYLTLPKFPFYRDSRDFCGVNKVHF